jgi:amino acid adenylation domain-containing protein
MTTFATPPTSTTVPGVPEVELAAPGGDHMELVSLAGLVAVLHRRTLQETIRIARAGADGTDLGTVSVAVTGDFGFRRIVELVETAVAAGDPVDTPADARHRYSWCPGWSERPGPRAGEPFVLHVRATPSMTYAAVAPGAAMSPETAAEITEQVGRAVIEGLLRPDHPLATLPLAGRAETARVLLLGGAAAAPAPRGCVHELVAAQAARTPGRIAVSCATDELTYRALDERAGRLAARLTAAGAEVDRPVAVLAERSVDLVVALLAVLKAGAAYAAIDPELPPGRVESIVADTGATVVLAQARLAGRAPAGTTVVTVEEPSAGAQPQPAAPHVGPDHLAYISYTSGSTGVPKGAAITHAAVTRLVREPDWAEFRAEDVFLQLAPVAFDASTLELWAPLTAGARLAVFPPGPVDLDALADTLKAERVTVLWLTAGPFQQLAAVRPDAFGGLRHLLAGGDVVSPGRLEEVLRDNPALTFTNGYGPTENTTFTACWTSRAPSPRAAVPIGRPIRGTRVLVLDPDLQPAPVGVPGELYAAGAGLARGYLGRPAATGERFLPDPFGPGGSRMYRTGDLAVWRADGTLDFLGRVDRQIKVQGFRVEPGEVEAELLADPDVHDAVVVAQVDGERGRRLVAYVVADDPADAGPSARAAQLREALRDRLPSWMVPWAIVLLPELPLGTTGKVDRAALPPARRVARNLASEFVAPAGAVRTHLARLWSDLLAVEPIGVDDDFFELGGHSLIAAELLGEVQNAYAIEISARTLYLRPTIGELAEAVESLLAEDLPRDLPRDLPCDLPCDRKA